ncbi:MAG TPA: hypothetical protein VLX68_08345 [Chitinivibrionales bacterium]|nr:hypothetical protein [Chitinivibrionales bacterium]
MVKLKENYIIDKGGHKVGVFLDIKTYRKVINDLEELDDIRAYDEAKASGEKAIPFLHAVREIDQAHKKCPTK